MTTDQRVALRPPIRKPREPAQRVRGFPDVQSARAMQTRPASPLDLVAVEALFHRSITTADWLPPDRRVATSFAEASECEKVFVCVDERDHLLGFISVWEEEAFIHHLYVASEHQGRGVGTRLLESLRAWLPLPWALKCVVVNTKALAFYEARGFEVVELHRLDHPPHALMERRA